METHSSTHVGAILDHACDEFDSCSYWNIEDYLAEDESVPCIIKVPMNGMKQLETQIYASSAAEVIENVNMAKKN